MIYNFSDIMQGMINRRDFLKTTALTSSIAFTPLNLFANDKKTIQENYLCNFSAEGSSIDITSTIEDGITEFESIGGDNLNVKSYHNYSYQSHDDRIETPLLKMKNGKYDKNGTFTPISWKKAFQIMSDKAKSAHKSSGTNGVGLATSGNISIDESYALMKLFKAGFRSNNIFNTAHYTSYPSMQASVAVFGCDSNNGDYQDIYYTDTLISWGVNFAETYPALHAKILKAQSDKKNNYKFINISTTKNRTSNLADLNIFIKPQTDLLILNFIAREFIYNNENKINWDILKQRTVFASVDTKQSNDADRLKQWEISYFEYKKSLEKYTLEYVTTHAKSDEEDLETFKSKLQTLAKHYINQTTKATSIWASGINKQKNATDTNIALYSLHLLLNKHSRPGCSTLSISGQTSSNGSAIEVGAFANRLPANRYIKYKEHRVETEVLWHLPEKTLNPIASNDQMELFKNIQDNVTKFLWIVHANPYQSTPNNLVHIDALEQNDDMFVVTSDCFYSLSASLSDLILPSASHLEKHSIYGSSNRETKVSNQYLVPYANSMSTLWQITELSKFLYPNDLWGRIEATQGNGLESVKHKIRALGYKENDSFYRILYGNKKAKSYKQSPRDKRNLNSEFQGDKRDIVGTEDTIFNGYKFYIQKYLFEEYRMFGRGKGYDLASFENYQDKSLKWPHLYNKSTYYRFNPIDDIYARKAAKLQDRYIFYGKMGSKQLAFGGLEGIRDENKKELKFRAKIFTVQYKEKSNNPKKNELLLISHKAIEHWSTGTITMKIKELKNSLPMAYCYMNQDDMKKLLLKNQDLVILSSKAGKLKTRVMFDKRFNLPKGVVSIGNYDERVLINKITNTINDTYIQIKKIKEDKNV
jgi:nitrate reductase NapA